MNTPPIVCRQEWDTAREQMPVKEKELTRARDALAAERRRMPWMAVNKDYEFDGPDGKASLLDLFDGRRQLIVYRFFFEPGVDGWPRWWRGRQSRLRYRPGERCLPTDLRRQRRRNRFLAPGHLHAVAP